MSGQQMSNLTDQCFNLKNLDENILSNLKNLQQPTFSWEKFYNQQLQSETTTENQENSPIFGNSQVEENGANAVPTPSSDQTDSYLNFTLNKTWGPKSTPQCPPTSGSQQTTTPLPRKNYQYNPNSTTTRVRGSLCWDGYLPPHCNETSELSRKVFLGGVPWDLSEVQLQQIFGRYGDFKVEWPSNLNSKRSTTKSFLYLIFQSLSSIPLLLNECGVEQHGGSVTYNLRLTPNMADRPAQLIPWFVQDNSALYRDEARVDGKLTVFVGALHGRLYAHALAHIFEEVFGNVAYVQIDTDRYKYPIGSGRVTFATFDSYRAAIEENFLTIVAPKFSKRIQIEPYIEDAPCGRCQVLSAPYFCKDRLCFDYFCDNCWGWHHSIRELRNHQPVKRNRKTERI